MVQYLHLLFTFLWLTALVVPSRTYSLDIAANYPDANLRPTDALFLRGDSFGLSWDSGVAMTHCDNNTWCYSASFDNLPETDPNFKVLVNDETWQVGVNEEVHFSTHPPSKEYSVDFFPWFHASEGTLHVVKNLYSPQLGNYRNIIVYLPPSYDENPLKIYENVLIMHDGQNLFDPKTAFLQPWWCQNTLNEMIGEGLLQEVAVVGVYNTPDRLDEYTYSYDPSEKGGGKGDLYLDFLEQDILPFVAKEFGGRLVVSNRERLGILGSSLGGLISCYAGWTRSKTYGRIGCMSSSFWWNTYDFDTTVMESGTMPEEPIVFYLDTGDVKDCYNSTIAVRDHFEKLKPFKLDENFFFYLDKGATHNEYYWGKRFHIPMSDLYPVEPHVV